MFYTFNQNNSGGGFDHDPAMGIGATVIIEADSAEQANKRAVEIGLYFKGVRDGHDCECCGDRWHECRDDEGTETPERYGMPVNPGNDFWGIPVYIHYLDGTFK